MSEQASPEQLRHPSALASAGRPFALLYRRWAVPRKLAAYGICLAAGPFLAGLFLLGSVRNRSFLIDFHYAFYPAGHAVAHGLSPYVPVAELHAQRIPFVYPVVAAWLFAPFSLLPYTAAAAIYFALTLAALWGGLALLGIRDPRCYTVVCLWPAVLDDLQTGALGGAMLVALALVWRYRDRDGGPVALAVVVATKLFLWPVGMWLILTRRWRAAVIAAVAGAVLIVLPWAVLGFAGLATYPDMLRQLTDQEGGSSYALTSLVSALRLPAVAAYPLAAALAYPGLRLFRRRDGRHRDIGVITGCLVLALALTPILWLHYTLILLLPLALVQPRLTWLWWLPVVLLVSPSTHPNGDLLPLILFWTVVAVFAVQLPRMGRPDPVSVDPDSAAAYCQSRLSAV